MRDPTSWQVLLNGAEVSDWVTADVDLGVVMVLRRGPVREVIYEGSRPATELLRGEVLIQRKPWRPSVAS